MKKIICFECGNKSTDYVFKKSIRKYEGDGFKFDLEVETPYCEKCGSQLYDREIEEKVRDKAHNLIISQTKDNDKVCGLKLYHTEARCNVIASHWTDKGTLLCIRADGVVETKYRVNTYETTEDNLEIGWR